MRCGGYCGKGSDKLPDKEDGDDLYFISDGRYIKIGRSASPERRRIDMVL